MPYGFFGFKFLRGRGRVKFSQTTIIDNKNHQNFISILLQFPSFSVKKHIISRRGLSSKPKEANHSLRAASLPASRLVRRVTWVLSVCNTWHKDRWRRLRERSRGGPGAAWSGWWSASRRRKGCEFLEKEKTLRMT